MGSKNLGRVDLGVALDGPLWKLENYNTYLDLEIRAYKDLYLFGRGGIGKQGWFSDTGLRYKF